ncbi:MAG: CDP-alcohol phosphatidyltransferase family protein [Clostridiales bacterium]|nr:CDP-alcohol phosphatidyltransferase family protein [Clostridiales bacterium]
MIGVYDYTVILTYLSMLSGVAGTILSMSGLGHPYIGMFFLLFCGLCDGFDGRVARTKKDRTEFEKNYGIQIDSFSDLIAFGVLPVAIGMAMLRASIKYHDLPKKIDESGQVIWYPVILIIIGLIYVLAAMIRLSYFNATEDERKAETEAKGRMYFTGMPVTMASIFFPLVLVLHFGLRFDFSIVYFIVMLVMAFLFVLKIKIPKAGSKMLAFLIIFGFLEFIAILLFRIFGKGI